MKGPGESITLGFKQLTVSNVKVTLVCNFVPSNKKLAEDLHKQFSYWALGRVITYLLSYHKINLIQDTFEFTGLILFRTMAIDTATICFPIKTKFSGYIQAILCTT